MAKNLLCSNCFTDEGLRLDAFKIGIDTKKKCRECNSTDGKKLSSEQIAKLSHRFFVRGTLHKALYGAAPIIQFNNRQKTNIKVSDALSQDIRLIEKSVGVGFLYYGPRLWMVGEIEPLDDLRADKRKSQVLERIVNDYPRVTLNPDDTFYRLRVNPEYPKDHLQYDSPPTTGNGRLDSSNLPILYGSQDLEVCVHECRVTVEDELYIASLQPKVELNLLDLTELLEEDVSEFESLDIAIHMLFYAGDHSYEICREIALKVKEGGYDGIIYPSYFSTMRTGAMPFDTVYGVSIRKLPLYTEYAKSQVIPNIALFGKPIQEEKVIVKCINKLILSKVQYDVTFGPVEY